MKVKVISINKHLGFKRIWINLLRISLGLEVLLSLTIPFKMVKSIKDINVPGTKCPVQSPTAIMNLSSFLKNQ